MLNEKFYRIFFACAALYNIFWGIVIILYPALPFALAEITPLNYPFLMSGIGMFVGVYGYGYWVVSREPRRYPQLVVIGLMGKVLGPVGWAYHVYLDSVPLRTMWVNVFNDLIWIPFFITYLIWYRKNVGAL
ncbi:MAG: alkyl hydroperoxide reductase [Cytophagaceae bacterium]